MNAKVVYLTPAGELVTEIAQAITREHLLLKVDDRARNSGWLCLSCIWEVPDGHLRRT